MKFRKNAARDHMIVAKFLAGRSRKEISEWAGIHCSTVSLILKRNNMGLKRRAEIRAASEENLYPGSVWIKGHEGKYRIFPDGRVLSLIYRKPNFLKPLLHKNGRISVFLGEKNKTHIHVLVAKHFVPGWKAGLEVNHKNGIKTDNRAENLEWVTRLENMRHSFRTGLNILTKPVIATSKNGEELYFESLTKAAEKINGYTSGISECCNGNQKTYKGFTWRHANESVKAQEQIVKRLEALSK